MARQKLDREDALQVLQLARILQQLQEPERKARESQKTREALLQRLLITQQGAQQRQRPQVTGLSGIQSVLGRSQDVRTELLRDVDPEDAEAVAQAEAQAAAINRPEAQFLREMAIALFQAGDPGSAQLGTGLADIVSPPSKKELSRRRVRTAARRRATGEQPGTFAVTGGPRAGFRAEGTPAQILAQLIETRPEALKRKLGATRAPVRPTEIQAPPTPAPTPFVEERPPTPTGAFPTIFGDIPIPTALPRDLPLEAQAPDNEFLISLLRTLTTAPDVGLLGRRP